MTRNGDPVGELTPLHSRRFIRAAEAVAIFRGAPEVDYGRFREDLDAVVDQDVTPRV